jgi:cytochrome c oxidase subunit 4
MAKVEHDHVVPVWIYVGILVALMVLLALTVFVAFFDLDARFHSPFWNMGIAVFIAMCKAFLIILFFMHVKYSSHVVWAFAGAAFVWLGILMTLTLTDYVTRPRPQPPSAVVSPYLPREAQAYR